MIARVLSVLLGILSWTEAQEWRELGDIDRLLSSDNN